MDPLFPVRGPRSGVVQRFEKGPAVDQEVLWAFVLTLIVGHRVAANLQGDVENGQAPEGGQLELDGLRIRRVRRDPVLHAGN